MASETIAAREGWILQSNRNGSWSIWAKGDGSEKGGPCMIHGNGIGDALRFLEGWRAARAGLAVHPWGEICHVGELPGEGE